MIGRIGLSRCQAAAPAAAARRLSTAVRASTATSQAAADALNAPLSATDPELFDIIEHEKLRQEWSQAYSHTRSPGIHTPDTYQSHQKPRAEVSYC